MSALMTPPTERLNLFPENEHHEEETSSKYPPLRPAEEELESVRFMIRGLISKIRRNKGGDPDDLQSDAYFYFMKAYSSYDYSTKFSTWVQTKIWYGLLETSRSHAHDSSRREHLGIMQHRVEENTVERRRDFDLDQWLEELSEDGRAMAYAALDPPPDIRVECPSGPQRSPYSYVVAVENYFRDLGWNSARVAAASAEIWEHLRNQNDNHHNHDALSSRNGKVTPPKQTPESNEADRIGMELARRIDRLREEGILGEEGAEYLATVSERLESLSRQLRRTR
jgi:hypothetical protein